MSPALYVFRSQIRGPMPWFTTLNGGYKMTQNNCTKMKSLGSNSLDCRKKSKQHQNKIIISLEAILRNAQCIDIHKFNLYSMLTVIKTDQRQDVPNY